MDNPREVTKPESQCPPLADDSSAVADHGTDAFEEVAIAEAKRGVYFDNRDSEMFINDPLMDVARVAFVKGARWAREWTLANDETVRRLVETLKVAQLTLDGDMNRRLLERVCDALERYKSATPERGER